MEIREGEASNYRVALRNERQQEVWKKDEERVDIKEVFFQQLSLLAISTRLLTLIGSLKF